eukprot:TRINITY_DN4037_c0_g1_i1.p1 TRINITY_DN4037_c0_g1~~TRINITY_DN4037_c0_g1_i1.p1  ORF type:complete len:191 (+),score=82.06 TRINITY_DN4037_c0_g1_i1:26-574(+)
MDGRPPHELLLERISKIQELTEARSPHWDFKSTGVTDAGAKFFADALAEHPFITTLDLTDNTIGPDGAQAIAEALARNSTLRSLNLFANRIGPAGAVSLAAALEANGTLRELDVGSNGIGNSGALRLAAMLRRNRGLTAIDVGGNGINDDTAKILIEAASHSLVKDLKVWELFQDPTAPAAP